MNVSQNDRIWNSSDPIQQKKLDEVAGRLRWLQAVDIAIGKTLACHRGLDKERKRAAAAGVLSCAPQVVKNLKNCATAISQLDSSPEAEEVLKEFYSVQSHLQKLQSLAGSWKGN